MAPLWVTLAWKVKLTSPPAVTLIMLFESNKFVPVKVKSVLEINCKPVGNKSFTCTLVALSGPAFFTLMV